MNMKSGNLKGLLQLFFLLIATGVVISCKDEDPNAQLNNEIKAIDEFLVQLNNDDLKLIDATGIRMIIHGIGEMPSPKTGQTVKVTYNAKLFSDASTFSSGTITDKLENIAPEGLRYSLTALLGSSNATLFIPSKYGYGETGTTGVPPNSTLVYEVILDEVVPTAAQQTQFTVDTTAIHQYLISNNIQNAIKHSSGVWYTIDAIGTGTSSRPYDNVSFDYTVKIMSNGSVVQTETFGGYVFDLIEGLKVTLSKVREGGAATFYIPSGLGYGPEGSPPGKIPANANLIFTIKLNSVVPFGS